MPREQ
ncbi:hypothetical protein Nmel_017696 [Mimus melanotis]